MAMRRRRQLQRWRVAVQAKQWPAAMGGPHRWTSATRVTVRRWACPSAAVEETNATAHCGGCRWPYCCAGAIADPEHAWQTRQMQLRRWPWPYALRHYIAVRRRGGEEGVCGGDQRWDGVVGGRSGEQDGNDYGSIRKKLQYWFVFVHPHSTTNLVHHVCPRVFLHCIDWYLIIFCWLNTCGSLNQRFVFSSRSRMSL